MLLDFPPKDEKGSPEHFQGVWTGADLLTSVVIMNVLAGNKLIIIYLRHLAIYAKSVILLLTVKLSSNSGISPEMGFLCLLD